MSGEKLLDIIIPVRIQSGNAFINSRNPRAYQYYRNTWFRAMRLLLPSGQEPARKRRKLEIVRYCRRKFDEVNFYAGCKPVEDYLVAESWIVDDAEEYCEIIRRQEKTDVAGHVGDTHVRLWEGTGPELPPIKRGHYNRIQAARPKSRRGMWTEQELKRKGLI